MEVFNVEQEAQGKAILMDDFGTPLFLGDEVTVDWRDETRNGKLCYAEDYMRFEIELYNDNGTVDDFAHWGTGEMANLKKKEK
jgi:hypothetical protein